MGDIYGIYKYIGDQIQYREQIYKIKYNRTFLWKVLELMHNNILLWRVKRKLVSIF